MFKLWSKLWESAHCYHGYQLLFLTVLNLSLKTAILVVLNYLLKLYDLCILV
jgi:hypothetical protein